MCRLSIPLVVYGGESFWIGLTKKVKNSIKKTKLGAAEASGKFMEIREITVRRSTPKLFEVSGGGWRSMEVGGLRGTLAGDHSEIPGTKYPPTKCQENNRKQTCFFFYF